jgi:hypothetical protein
VALQNIERVSGIILRTLEKSLLLHFSMCLFFKPELHKFLASAPPCRLNFARWCLIVERLQRELPSCKISGSENFVVGSMFLENVCTCSPCLKRQHSAVNVYFHYCLNQSYSITKSTSPSEIGGGNDDLYLYHSGLLDVPQHVIVPL